MKQEKIDISGVDYFCRPLEDSLVITHDAAEKLYILNGTGRVVFESLLDGASTLDIANDIASVFDIPVKLAEKDISTAIKNWVSEGLLPKRDGQFKHAIKKATPWVDDKIDLNTKSLPTKSSEATTRYYSMPGATFSISYCNKLVERQLANRIESYAVEKIDNAPVKLEIFCSDGSYSLYENDVEKIRNKDVFEITGWALGSIIDTLHQGRKWLIYLHAAAISDGEKCIVFPAFHGRGKSTLVSALVGSGLTYYSDDIVPIDKETLKAVAMPVDICLKEGSWEVAARYLPNMESTESLIRVDGQNAKYVAPPPSSVPGPQAMAPLKDIIFVNYSPGEKMALAPISKVEVLERLVESNSKIQGHPESVEALLTLIESVGAFTLKFDDLEEAVAIIRRELAC